MPPPLPPPYGHRLLELRSRLPRLRTPGFAVTSLTNVRYLSGYTGSSAALVITRDDAVIVSDFRYRTQIAEECPGYEYVESPRSLLTGIADVAKQSRVRRLAIESTHLTLAQHQELQKRVGKVTLVPTKQVVEKLRQVKALQEIAAIREAARITDAAYAFALTRLHPSITERELAFEIEAFMRRSGAEEVAFPPIVASGPRSALPHARPTDKRIERGNLVTFDLGARYRGYCADLTRTVCVGAATARQKKLYATVYGAQRQALRALRGEKPGVEVDAAARKYLERRGFGLDFFGHGTGHGVGLEVHEMPGLGRFSRDAVPTGSVVTVEPGVYVPDEGGVRIEDLCLVTATGHEVLSAADKPEELPVV